MFVAKSYEGLEIVEDEYKKGNKTYCKVRTKSGTTKEVRTYTETEYNKMYGASAIPAVKCNQRKMLGFDKGYITIFKGPVAQNEHFFDKSNARFHIALGWYIVSSEEVPKLPDNIIPIQLFWNEVGNEDGTLKSIDEVKKIVRKKLS